MFTYLQACEPQELVHVSGNVYCTREHDSLRISNGKWCWFSRGIGGYSALDYLIKVKGCSFMEAMEAVAGRAAAPPPSFTSVPREEKPKHLLLPPPAPNNQAMLDYLKGRGISMEVLDFCVQTGRIYESRNKGHGNVVFVGFDKTGKARFGCLRGISEGRFHGDLSGSDKHYSFALPACGKIRLSICVSVPLMSCPMPAFAGWTESTGNSTTCCLWPGYISRRKRLRRASCLWPSPVFRGLSSCENRLSPSGQRRPRQDGRRSHPDSDLQRIRGQKLPAAQGKGCERLPVPKAGYSYPGRERKGARTMSER